MREERTLHKSQSGNGLTDKNNMDQDLQKVQRLKLLYLRELLLQKTDDEHGLSSADIIEELQKKGIRVERKTLYTDMEALREYGMDIIMEHIGRQTIYHVGSREFELAELKVIVDLIQASKFLTDKKSHTLIQKIEGLTSVYEAEQLHHKVHITGRVKAENEKIYYNVDLLHTAMNKNVRVHFQYFQWNIKKEQELRHDGKIYTVSPLELCWDDENYYLIGFDHDVNDVRHYRVDKILNLELTEELQSSREGVIGESIEKDNTDDIAGDAVAYKKKMFGMFGGETQRVRLRVAVDKIGVMIDRFGKDIVVEQNYPGYIDYRNCMGEDQKCTETGRYMKNVVGIQKNESDQQNGNRENRDSNDPDRCIEENARKQQRNHDSDNHSKYVEVEVEVAVSDHFFGWILSLGNDVKIVEPDCVVEQMKEMLKERMGVYDVG